MKKNYQSIKGTVLISLIFSFCSISCLTEKDEFSTELKNVDSKLTVQLAVFDGAHLADSKYIEFLSLGNNQKQKDVIFKNAKFEISHHISKIEDRDDAYKLSVNAKVSEGEIDNFSLGLSVDFTNWSTQNYVLMPGSAYNGNRYNAVRYQRKHLCETVECSPGMEPVMTTVPRLQIGEGNSFMKFLSGDMSTPSFAVQIPSREKGMFILTEQGTKWGDYSYTLQESDDRTRANLLLRMPALREDSTQLGREKFYPSPDRGIHLKQGDQIELNCLVYFFDASTVQKLFDEYVVVRKDIGTRTVPNQIPYSATWKIQEEKYNAQNWVEQYGYYSVGMREVSSQDWQTAWVGGLNTVFPLLVNGDETTRSRVLRTFDFVLDTVSASGFPYDRFYNGVWNTESKFSFMRYNGDALYFMLKSYGLFRELYPDRPIPEKWLNGSKLMADALVDIFGKYGQFGQHVNNETREIIAGGTASASLAIGALALCADFYKNPTYLETAKAAGEYYYQNFTRKGLTNGGPGDIFQCPDSESAFGLLESYVVLYETTGDPKWLQIAKEAANQCASWVVSYDFKFPENSTFNKLGMLTNGTVIANVQNKHSAPGICSLSGSSLFKLYRYTNDETYLELIADIAKAIPQYMSREDRPIVDIREGQRWPVMPPGWINERVNMSDWEERGTPGDIKRGEIFGGSTWAEVACMLSYAELPGIYILKDKGFVTSLDNITAKVISQTEKTIELELYNPSNFDAKVKVWAENSFEMKKVLPSNYMLHFEEIPVQAKAKRTLILKY